MPSMVNPEPGAPNAMHFLYIMRLVSCFRSGAKSRLTMALPIVLLSLALQGGCSLPWSKPKPASDPGAAALLEDGNASLKNKQYKHAIMQFEKLRQDYPFSAESVEVDLRIAEAYYLNEQYSEAAQGFKDFMALRPTHKEVPFVLYRLGLVYFDQLKGIDQDQKNIEIAIPYFERVVKEYPGSPYAAGARDRIRQCREYLAGHEFYVGSFYLKQKNYAAAQERFETIVRRYLNTPQGVEALYQLGESYRLANNSVKAALAYESVIKHYPDNALAKSARVELSRLNSMDRDPLAQLLLEDGRPAFSPGTDGAPLAVTASAQAKAEKPVLIEKKEVDYEEGGAPKGFFSRLASAVNPFDSSGDEKSLASNGDRKNGSPVKAASNGDTDPGASEKGFFRRIADTINPFSSSPGNGTVNGKPNGGLQQAGGPEGETTDNNVLVGKIDASLKEKVPAPEGDGHAPGPPVPDLPQSAPQPAPSDTGAILSKIDQGLAKDGKNDLALPPAPAWGATAGAGVEAANKQTRAGAAATSKILGAIDKELKNKNLEPSRTETGVRENIRPAGLSPSKPQEQKATELGPRLSTEKKPFLLDKGEYQGVRNQPPPEQAKNQEKEAKEAGSSDKLAEGVLQEPSYVPPQKKQPEETKTAEQRAAEEDVPKGIADQIQEDVGLFRKLMNPFGW